MSGKGAACQKAPGRGQPDGRGDATTISGCARDRVWTRRGEDQRMHPATLRPSIPIDTKGTMMEGRSSVSHYSPLEKMVIRVAMRCSNRGNLRTSIQDQAESYGSSDGGRWG